MVFAQYPPPAGNIGSTAIHKDSSVFTAWATHCYVIRGWQHAGDTSLGKASAGDSSMACGMAGTNGIVSLGDGGMAVLTFEKPVYNGPSWDFAVFENSFDGLFLELAFVEVSSDGVNFFRFQAHSLTDTLVQKAAFDTLDAGKINNLAGKYQGMYGTPFDLQELEGNAGLDINYITHIRIADVTGSLLSEFASYDTAGNKINDPWPTAFPSGGFDLDALGVIHQNNSSVAETKKEKLLLYPNPCSETLHVVTENNSMIGEISICDMQGRILMSREISGGSVSFGTEGLCSGIYFILSDHHHAEPIKFLKQ